jgi:hypothetical protein
MDVKLHKDSKKIQEIIESILPKVRTKFHNLEGVQQIGFGLKEKDERITDVLAFRFYVDIKQSLSKISKKERIPQSIHGFSTDVIPRFQEATLGTVSASPAVNMQEYRDEGIRGGISIRNEHFANDHPSGYGTLGVLARRISDNALVGLTCSHVVNAASDAPTTLETRIGQPQYWISCCCCPRGWIGNVSKATINNDLDCALIAIDDDIAEIVTDNNTENKVEGIPLDISGAALPVLGDVVRKYGRSSGLTTGVITDLAYGTNHILIERTDGIPGDIFAHHGDSGAVIVNEDDQVIGLLVSAAQEVSTRVKLPVTKGIATLITPIMQDLGISIAGVGADDVTVPSRAKPWPGGQADNSLNPVEVFRSVDFNLTGNVDWDVSSGASGATIVETGNQTATGRSSISVRYDTVSASRNKTDAVSIKATKGADESEEFRTVFKITPRINTSVALDSNNTKRFNPNAGTDDMAGVAVPGIDGATLFQAKAEFIFEVLPEDIQWDASGLLNFVTGAPSGVKGDIIARRQTKFKKGQLAVVDPTPTRTEELNYISAGDSSADDFQQPTSQAPITIFRLANEGLEDPSTLLQAYTRADYRDYLEMHDGTTWIRITPFTEWFANLTADFNGPPSTAVAPPNVGTPNNVGIGATAEPIPAVIYCGFVGNGTIITKTALVDKIVEITEGEHDEWENTANGNRLEEDSALKFADLVIYCLAVQLRHNTIAPSLIASIQDEVRGFAGLTRNSNFTTVSNTISTNLGGNNNDPVAIRIRTALNNAEDSTRSTFPWSAVFITHCVRQAALDLGIEYEDALGAIQGQAKILEFGNSHSQYSRPAFIRRRDNIVGCYQAIEPDQIIEIGDIIIQDRRTCIINPPPNTPCPPAQVMGINNVRDYQALLQQPSTTHGDLVVEIDNATNSVIAIGGNVGDSARKRRYPINNLGILDINNANQRIYSQEQDNGNLGPTTISNNNALQGRSTSRIFAVLKLVEECQELP